MKGYERSHTSDKHGLILTVDQHVGIGIIGNGEKMRRDFRSTFSFVGGDNNGIVDGKHFIWIYSNAEETRISINQEPSISFT